jgi:ubiquinone/menaquinone biosynthesis C-methylase UbiE
MSYVYMKALEKKAEKYDRGIRILTFGKLPKIKQEIAENYIQLNDKLLDIGMGTGTFTILCAKRGAQVTGIDFSEKMLKVAQENINNAGVDEKIQVIRMPIINLDKQFLDKSFDTITAILCFSELYSKEQDYALDQIFRILKDDGQFILVDEVKPKNFSKKILYFIIRIPIAFINFLKAHISTKRLKNLEEKLVGHKFTIIEQKLYLYDSLILMRLKKQSNK